MTFPNLSQEKIISLDIETKDTELKKLGPGPRRDGKILGVAIAVEKGSWYFEPSENLFTWLKSLTDKTFIGANFLYDMDFLQYQDVLIHKALDIQVAEQLIDENQKKYSLDFMGHKYLGIGKKKDEIQEFCDRNGLKGDPRKHLWKMPPALVGKYAKIDAELNLNVFNKQLPILREQDLIDLFDLEMRLFPLLLKMRKVGIRIDRKKLYDLDDLYTKILTEHQEKLNKLVGFDCNVRSRIDVQKAFDKLGYPYGYNPPTEKMIAAGKDPNPCFNAAFLDSCDHELANLLRYIAKYRDISSKFTSTLDHHIVNGRIHPNFKSFLTEDGGTVSGRFSCKTPNLQQQCNAKKVFKDGRKFGKEIRSVFLPEEDHYFGKGDQAQIEMRLFFHYASGPGSDDIREALIKNPDLDCYSMLSSVSGIERDPTKTITLGLLYGMGLGKLCKSLKLTEEEGKAVINGYHEKLPYMRATTSQIQRVASSRGYIKTILKRRRRFPDKNWCYKAPNSLFQGSAADQLKKTMVDAYEAGVFDVLVPHLTVHDELDYSVPKTKAGYEAEKELKYIAENCVKFKVPLKFELERGENWGELKDV
jgi:DNA polymerase I-like protein with 3'-5' exonuclease and polymerase domains